MDNKAAGLCLESGDAASVISEADLGSGQAWLRRF